MAISIKQAGQALTQRVHVLHRISRITQSLTKIRIIRTHWTHGIIVLTIAALTISSGQLSDHAAQTHTFLAEESNGSSQTTTYIAADVAEALDLNLTARGEVAAYNVNGSQDLLAATQDHLPNVSTVTTDSASRDDIFEYTVQDDDTVASIAGQFALSENTIRWNNDLAANEEVEAGDTLYILPLDGVLHTVEDGDSGDSLAAHYGGDPSLIVSFNDAEIDGFVPGQEVVIPNGVLPESERPEPVNQQTAPSTTSTNGADQSTSTETTTQSDFTPQHSGGNGYAYGWCTWYVADQIDIPNNWGNAATWAARAEASGYTVTSQPQEGAIAQNSHMAGGLGHVGIVEEVRGDEIVMSDMNGFGGWGQVATGTAPVSQYQYIIP